jgi:hypothetical protein
MKLVDTALLTVLVMPLVACTDSGDRPDRTHASRAFGAVSNAIEAAAASLDDGARVAPLVGRIDFASACSLGGSIDIGGTHESNGGRNAFDLDAAFNACQENEGMLAGHLHWTSESDTSGYRDSWIGTLRFTDAYGEWECDFDLRTVVSATGYSYSGIACGYDVQSEL